MLVSPAVFFLIIAVVLIGAELLILQFSVFWFLFFGFGALVSAITCWFVPELSWVAATSIFLVASVLVSLLLYPPLKKWQAKPGPIAGHDAIGQQTKVISPIGPGSEGKVLWSGADWPAQLATGEEPFNEGDVAIIKELAGIRLIVGR